MSDEQHHKKLDFNPVLLGVFGILCGAVIVGTLRYLAISWCNIRRPRISSRAQPARPIREMSKLNIIGSSSDHLLKVYVYSKELKEGTCAVCLSEFVEGEEVRILPECAHTFHVPCVDMWLYSHPNCPLCRTCTTPRKAHMVISLPNSGELPTFVEESVPSSGEIPTPSESFPRSVGLLFPVRNSFVAF